MDRVREAESLIGMMERVAFALGIEVRYEDLVPDGEPGSTRGGLCRHRERELILIDSRLGPVERCAALAEALRARDLSEVFVPPAVRRLIEGDCDGGDARREGGNPNPAARRPPRATGGRR